MNMFKIVKRIDPWDRTVYCVENTGTLKSNSNIFYYHREDGPAMIWEDGEEWFYLNNIKLTKEEWSERILEIKLQRLKKL